MTSANPRNSSELPTLFGSFRLVDKTHVHLAWPAAHDVKSETLFEVIKHLIYGTVCYINIFTNLSLLSVEMYPPPKLSCESRHLAWASCLCQSFLSCTRCHKKSVGLLMLKGLQTLLTGFPNWDVSRVLCPRLGVRVKCESCNFRSMSTRI